MKYLKSLPALAWLRTVLWFRDAKQDEISTRIFAKRTQTRLLDVYDSPILDSSKSKTLFILGSGWSVNELTKDMQSQMRDHQSVGINFWFFHDFVPSVFSFDAGIVPDSEKEKVKSTLLSLGHLFAREAIVEALPKVLYLRPFELNPEYLIPLPRELQGNAWVSGRANLLANSQKALEADLRIFLPKLANQELPRHVLPDNGSSVVRLIFLALAQGFQQIVLVGVDLDNRPHFWFSPKYVKLYSPYIDLFPPPDQGLHGTATALNRPVGGGDFLIALDKVMRELGLGGLYVASPNSQLGETLERYWWPNTGAH